MRATKGKVILMMAARSMNAGTDPEAAACDMATEPSPTELVVLRGLVASAVRAFAAWLSARDDRVQAGDHQASDQMYRSTAQFLRDCRLEGEPYDPDWAGLLESVWPASGPRALDAG